MLPSICYGSSKTSTNVFSCSGPAKRPNFSALSSLPVGSGGGNGVLRKGPPGGGGSNGCKKLVIKNLKAKPVLPDNFQERSVDKLKRAVVAIQTSEAIKDVSLEELYQAVEDLCSHGMAGQVYASLKSLVELHVQESVKQFLGETHFVFVCLILTYHFRTNHRLQS